MYPPNNIREKIQDQLPDSQIEIVDLTGTQDHYQVAVASPEFVGKTMIQQHRIVKAIFDADIQSGVLHALSLKTYTPEEWTKRRK